MTIKRVGLVLLTLAASSSSYAGGGIAKKFQGQWQSAKKPEGKGTPNQVVCAANPSGSTTNRMAFSEAEGRYEAEYYFGSKDCKGPDAIKSKYRYAFQGQPVKGSSQILKVMSHSYEITVVGQKAVAALNSKKVCGFSQWQAKTYKNGVSPLKDCTMANIGHTIPPHIKKENLKDWRTRISEQGKGIAVASAQKPDAPFKFSMYFVAKK